MKKNKQVKTEFIAHEDANGHIVYEEVPVNKFNTARRALTMVSRCLLDIPIGIVTGQASAYVFKRSRNTMINHGVTGIRSVLEPSMYATSIMVLGSGLGSIAVEQVIKDSVIPFVDYAEANSIRNRMKDIREELRSLEQLVATDSEAAANCNDKDLMDSFIKKCEQYEARALDLEKELDGLIIRFNELTKDEFD